MTKVNVDLSNVKEFEALPAGKYEAIIESVQHGMSQEGKPTLKWTFAVAEGEYTGRKLFMNTSLQPQALWKLKATFDGLGLSTEDAEGNPTAIDLDVDDETNELTEPNLIGVAVLLTVSADRMWKNRKQNDVDDIVASSVLAGAGAATAPGTSKDGKKTYK